MLKEMCDNFSDHKCGSVLKKLYRFNTSKIIIRWKFLSLIVKFSPVFKPAVYLEVLVPYRYVALYNYKPQKEDEVELRKGDYYTVAEKCQDGWFKGTCLRTGAFGVFPGNYVQLVR